MLTYRAVRKADFPILTTFPKTADELYFCFPKGSFPLTIEQLTSTIEQRCHSTVVEKDGVVAGFANFYQWQNCGCCKIGNVMVNPDLRQQGIARYLLSAMTQLAIDIYNATELQVSCFNTNTTALLFYHKIGFSPIGIVERIDKQNQKIALIHMSKIL